LVFGVKYFILVLYSTPSGLDFCFTFPRLRRGLFILNPFRVSLRGASLKPCRRVLRGASLKPCRGFVRGAFLKPCRGFVRGALLKPFRCLIKLLRLLFLAIIIKMDFYILLNFCLLKFVLL